MCIKGTFNSKRPQLRWDPSTRTNVPSAHVCIVMELSVIIIVMAVTRYPVNHATCTSTFTCIALLTIPWNCICFADKEMVSHSAARKYGTESSQLFRAPSSIVTPLSLGSVFVTAYGWISVSGYRCLPVYAHLTYFINSKRCVFFIF